MKLIVPSLVVKFENLEQSFSFVIRDNTMKLVGIIEYSRRFAYRFPT